MEKKVEPGKSRPKVGVGVILAASDGGIWLLKRKGGHGAGTWAFAGGHVEHAEPMLLTTCREVEEEAGIHIEPTFVVETHMTIRTVFPDEGLDYFTFYFIGYIGDAEPKVMEEDKCDGWVKVKPGDELPTPLFKPLQSLVDASPFGEDFLFQLVQNFTPKG